MGRPPVVVKERVAEAALQIIDDEGLEALSIERIARELGVRGPSLYHHFKDKAEILSEVAKLVLGDLDLDHIEADSWQDWLVTVSLRLYRRVLAHPNATAILLQFMPDAAAVPGFGRAARMLTQQGVDPSMQVLIMEGNEKLIWGWALQRAATFQHLDKRLSPTAINRRWPELAVAVRESLWKDEELIEASLRAFMNGVLSTADEV